MKDSPISRLDQVESSLSGDLLLLSKPKETEPGQYNSVGIEYNNFVSSIISSMGSDLSTIVQQELSNVVGGTVTLATWKTIEDK